MTTAPLKTSAATTVPSKVTPPKRFSQHLPILSKVHGQQVHANKGIELNVRCLPRVIFSNEKKKSMKILMKVCSWHGFEKQLKKSNQFPASSQPKSISYNQYLSILGYTFGTSLPIAPPILGSDNTNRFTSFCWLAMVWSRSMVGQAVNCFLRDGEFGGCIGPSTVFNEILHHLRYETIEIMG